MPGVGSPAQHHVGSVYNRVQESRLGNSGVVLPVALGSFSSMEAKCSEGVVLDLGVICVAQLLVC